MLSGSIGLSYLNQLYVFIWSFKLEFKKMTLLYVVEKHLKSVRIYVCVCACDLRSHGEERYSPREEERGTAETNLLDTWQLGGK